MTQTDTLLPKPSITPERARSQSLVSLIEVPAVKGSRMSRSGSRGNARMDGHRESRRPYPVRRKRRLRREIRIAGCALLLMAPLVSACTVGWSKGPVRVLACSITEATAPGHTLDQSGRGPEPAARSEVLSVDSPGVIVLSSDPAAMPAGTDSEIPVIFPGYVLPDDSLEGSVHEGS